MTTMLPEGGINTIRRTFLKESVGYKTIPIYPSATKSVCYKLVTDDVGYKIQKHQRQSSRLTSYPLKQNLLSVSDIKDIDHLFLDHHQNSLNKHRRTLWRAVDKIGQYHGQENDKSRSEYIAAGYVLNITIYQGNIIG